jgi:hypothetical protein
MKEGNMMDVLDETAAAKFLGGISPRTLQKWRVCGGGPLFLKVGRRIRYTEADLVTWLNAQRRRSTSDRGGSAA